MQHAHSYLMTAVQIIRRYKGEEPFSSFLKKYFSQNRKHGSKDRKQISHLGYGYFRLGKSLPEIEIEERLLTGLFLCSDKTNEILEEFKPEWNKEIESPTEKKLLIIRYSLFIENVFPWKNELSKNIDHLKFCESFFVQPDLFLRLRPGCETSVKEKLLSSGIIFTEINSSCLALPNNSKIEKIIELDKEAVVQDYSSQRTGDIFREALDRLPPAFDTWDCCAASGGKSLLLYDINPGIELTVSDIRESILINLKKRFSKAGIKKYKCFVADLTIDSLLQAPDYDLIICDVPCSGSGTWGRTPEQLYFFDEKKTGQYSSLQKKIVSNAIPHLRRHGFFIYITCSVFKKENDEVVNYIMQKFDLKLMEKRLLTGYDKKADTLFAALFQKTK